MGRLKGTSFRIEKEAYQRMSKAVVSIYLMAVRSESDKDRYFANSMAGRHPFTGLGINFSRQLFETLIEVGGDVLGIPYDQELASYYNYFYKTKKYKDAPELKADGFYQFNFSPAGVYRQGNWLAVMRCPTTNFWGERYIIKPTGSADTKVMERWKYFMKVDLPSVVIPLIKKRRVPVGTGI